jgi:hypothetical protein
MAFRKAGEKKIGGKFLVFGDTASGKSFFTLTFPKVASIDSEAGVAHYEGRDIEIAGKKYNNLVMVDNTADLDELEDNIDALSDGDYDGQIETLSIDSETKFYNTMQVGAMEVEERRARKTGADVDDQTVSTRQWGRIKLINMKLQQVKIDLSAKGINVISVAQGTDERDKKDSDKIIGEKPDMHKSAKFDYDTILRFYKEKDKKTSEIRYLTEVLKDRTEVTKEGQILENCTFDIWKNYYAKKNNLESMKTTYAKDLKSSTESMIDDADKAEELVKKIKNLLKTTSADNQKAIGKKMRDLEINIKDLSLNPSEKLTEVLKFAEAL